MSLENLVATFGLSGVALGVAVEGEGMAFLGGVISHRGLFPVWGAVLAAVSGAIVSDNASFAAGRFFGHAAPVRGVLERGGVGRLRDLLERHPTAFILSFRFLYGLKFASAALLGTTQVPWPRFFALNLVSSVVWANVWVWLGFAGGAAIVRVFGALELHWHLLAALAVSVLVVVALLLVRRYAFRRERVPAEGDT